MLYLDWAAAAPPEPETLEYARDLWRTDFANQESGHALGFALRRKLDAAAQTLSRTFWGVPGGKAVWGTSCTELFQLLAASPLVSGRRVVSSVLEHPALASALRREAGNLKLLASAPDGKLVPESMENVSLVAFHQVQSELGAVQDLDKLFAAFPGAVRFADAAQGAGKIAFPRGADIVAISGAKLGVPGGGAALLLAPRWKGAAEFCGFAAGFRRNEHRVSRVHPAVPQLLAFAAERRVARMAEASPRIAELNAQLRAELTDDEVFPTLPEENASPYILHLSVPKHQGAVLMRMLAQEKIMVSAGSACAAESKDPSPALLALGASRETAYGGLRISMSRSTPDDAPEIFLAAWKKVLQNY